MVTEVTLYLQKKRSKGNIVSKIDLQIPYHYYGSYCIMENKVRGYLHQQHLLPEELNKCRKRPRGTRLI